MSKYEKLGRYLRRQLNDRHTMSFAEIESVLDSPLPASARKYLPWWANQSDGAHVQCSAWMGAGWRVSSVDLAAQLIGFQRIAAESRAGVSQSSSAPFHHRDDPPPGADLVTFDRAELVRSLAA